MPGATRASLKSQLSQVMSLMAPTEPPKFTHADVTAVPPKPAAEVTEAARARTAVATSVLAAQSLAREPPSPPTAAPVPAQTEAENVTKEQLQSHADLVTALQSLCRRVAMLEQAAKESAIRPAAPAAPAALPQERARIARLEEALAERAARCARDARSRADAAAHRWPSAPRTEQSAAQVAALAPEVERPAVAEAATCR